MSLKINKHTLVRLYTLVSCVALASIVNMFKSIVADSDELGLGPEFVTEYGSGVTVSGFGRGVREQEREPPSPRDSA